jgi:hypothetical protein
LAFPSRPCRCSWDSVNGCGHLGSLDRLWIGGCGWLFGMNDRATSAEFDHIDGAFFTRNKVATWQKDDLARGTETYETLGGRFILDRSRG